MSSLSFILVNIDVIKDLKYAIRNGFQGAISSIFAPSGYRLQG